MSISPKRLDLKGMRFGLLTARENIGKRVKGRRLSYWVCDCDCGNKSTVETSKLRTGHTKSCGCLSLLPETNNRIVDLKGRKFGRLSVVTYFSGSKWACRCDCGAEAVVDSWKLQSGRTVSCGCRLLEVKSDVKWVNYKHGLSNLPEYGLYINMITRCNNPKSSMYYRYGGRGIVVCDRWMESFANFISDMGRRPSQLYSLDRVDNDSGYSPENCRWATRIEQANNTSRNRLVKYNDKVYTAIELARHRGVGISKVFYEIKTKKLEVVDTR